LRPEPGDGRLAKAAGLRRSLLGWLASAMRECCAADGIVALFTSTLLNRAAGLAERTTGIVTVLGGRSDGFRDRTRTDDCPRAARAADLAALDDYRRKPVASGGTGRWPNHGTLPGPLPLEA